MRTAGRTDLRRSWARIGIVLVMVGTLGGCAATIPLKDQRATLQKPSADLEIDPGQISSYSRCLIGPAGGSTPGAKHECVYLQTPTWASVPDYDVKAKKFSRTYTFDSHTRGVAIQERSAFVGPLRQLQVRAEDAVLAMEFINADLGQIGQTAKLIAAHEHLKDLGVPSMTPGAVCGSATATADCLHPHLHSR